MTILQSARKIYQIELKKSLVWVLKFQKYSPKIMRAYRKSEVKSAEQIYTTARVIAD